MGISFGNTGHIGSSDDLESKLSHISKELERTSGKLGACIPVEVRSVEDLTNCIGDAEHFLTLLYRARRILSELGR